jgi:hypothetical protein
MGGFISEDPAGFAGGQPSFYAAFGSDPLDFNDPFGLNAAAAALPFGEAAPIAEVGGAAGEGGFLASNPVGWVVLAGSLGYGAGTAINNAYGQDISDWIWNTTHPNAVNASGKGDFWDGLQPWRGGTRTNGKSGKKRRYYEWDYTHGDIEEYDSNGRHCGSLDGETGEPTKPPVPGRDIDI